MALGSLVKCRRVFPVEWRSGGWYKPETRPVPVVIREVPFSTSQREFNRREAVPASFFNWVGTANAIGLACTVHFVDRPLTHNSVVSHRNKARSNQFAARIDINFDFILT